MTKQTWCNEIHNDTVLRLAPKWVQLADSFPWAILWKNNSAHLKQEIPLTMSSNGWRDSCREEVGMLRVGLLVLTMNLSVSKKTQDFEWTVYTTRTQLHSALSSILVLRLSIDKSSLRYRKILDTFISQLQHIMFSCTTYEVAMYTLCNDEFSKTQYF